MEIAALILDFDGTILDTETPIFEEWAEEYRRYGQELEVSFWGRGIGTHGVVDLAVRLAGLAGDGHDPKALRRGVRRRVRERLAGEPLRPGIEGLLDDAGRSALPMAIASSSTSGWVESWLDRHGIRDRFDPICGRDHVERAKPAPDLFLLAAEGLGVEPAACLVFEDSPNGVLAAGRAGMPCVVVPNPVTRHLEMPETSLALESLEGVRLAEVLRRI